MLFCEIPMQSIWIWFILSQCFED